MTGSEHKVATGQSQIGHTHAMCMVKASLSALSTHTAAFFKNIEPLRRSILARATWNISYVHDIV